MKLKRNSWHYRLAERGSVDIGHWAAQTTLCDYLSAMFWGALLTLAVSFMAFMASYLALDFAMWLTVSLKHGWFEIPMGAFLFAMFVSAGAFLAVAIGIVYLTAEAQATEPLREAYRGWKEKYCPVVVLHD